MERQLREDRRQLRGLGGGPWKPSLVMFLQMTGKETCPVKSAPLL